MPTLKRRHCIGFALLLLCRSAIAHADAIDLTSPRSAAKSLSVAVQHADAAAIRQILLVPNDPQQHVVAAYSDLILAGKRLAESAKAKFPNTTSAFSQGTISPAEAAKIDSAPIETSGDTASLNMPGRSSPMQLQRVANQWHVLIQDVDPGANGRPDQLAILRALSEAMNTSADEIDAGKYHTVQEAESAVAERLGAVVPKSVQGDLPTTKPTTRP